MGIGDYDMHEILNIKNINPQIKTCAILGDCSFHYRDGNKEHFKKIMNLDIVHTFDINGNPDYKLDLQEPLPIEFKEKYDLILDIGTLYCIFDIPSCLKNMLFILKSNGIIFHNSNLVGHFGRGFYALSPSFYNEFYRANNFDIIKMAYLMRGGSYKWIPMPIGKNYLTYADMNKMIWEDKGTTKSLIPCDSSILCIVKRNSICNFNKPIPEHYCKTNGK
tara:strand:+ start:185 stop:844 length:660 start_codon:yes stop_codon:yes gene_type:complete